MNMNTKQRKALKAQAHHLKPVVRVGQKGVSVSLLEETSQALDIHELIKVHVADDDRDSRSRCMEELASRCGAELVDRIGKICILYRKRNSE
jgi:RNA-binding protein